MYSVADSERMAAAYLAAAPAYDLAGWLDEYAMTLGECFPDRKPEDCSKAAQRAHESMGFCDPTIAAMLEAQIGAALSVPRP